MRFGVFCLYLAFSLGAQASLLDDLREIKLSEYRKASRLATAIPQAQPEEVPSIRQDYLESRARADLMDRLIFFYDSHFKGGDERQFLRFAALNVAKNEVKNPQFTTQNFWVFLRNLAQVLDTKRESGQTPGNTLQAYLEYSDVLNPKDPQGFLRSMDYTNGLDNESVSNNKKFEDIQPVDTAKPLAPPKLKPVVITSES